jgi:HTH-type transcriptional regulator, sugar sensing transcriptional regulator
MESELFRLLGLSEKEKEIYSTLLKLGPMSVFAISQQNFLNRTFCYDLVEKMIKKGVLLQTKSPKKVYQAVPLEQLNILLEKSYMDSKKELETLKEIKSEDKKDTEILEFRGHYAVFNLFRRLFTQKGEINSFWSKKIGQLFQEFIKENVKIRVTHKIPLKVITDDDEWTKKWLKDLSFEKNYRQVKYLKDFYFESMIYIFNNEVAIITYEKNVPYGLLIKNKEYYNTQKKIFDSMWKQAKP